MPARLPRPRYALRLPSLRQAAAVTVNIVGKGPSLLTLTATDFAPGPVIALNQAIHQVRTILINSNWWDGRLGPLYSFQKDGCEPHASADFTPSRTHCYQPACYASDMVEPVEPEILIVSRRESPHCWERYKTNNREVVDVESELQLPWTTPSIVCAVQWSWLYLGIAASSLRMLACDAMFGDTRRVEQRGWYHGDSWEGDATTPDNGDTWLVDDATNAGYLPAAMQAHTIAKSLGMSIEWVAPKTA